MKTPFALFLTLVLLLPSGAAAAEKQAQVTDWQVPWEGTRPRDPDLDPQGKVWFVGQTGHYLARLDPDSGEFERYELPAGAGPHNCIVDPDSGIVWYAGNRAAHIGRLDPKTGEIRQYPMPDPRARDPHTLVFDSAGDIWFTLQQSNMIGKLAVATGEITLIEIATRNARPYGIRIDQDDRPWAVLFNSNKLATVDPKTMQLEEISLPREGARPRRLDVTSDGRIWYVDYAEGRLGVYDPRSKRFQEWDSPARQAARPYAMAVDDQDRLWYVESGPQPNRLVGFDSKRQEFVGVTVLEKSRGSTRHMVHYDGVLWFGLDTNYITRAILP